MLHPSSFQNKAGLIWIEIHIKPTKVTKETPAKS
jgi:hypothetical protein